MSVGAKHVDAKSIPSWCLWLGVILFGIVLGVVINVGNAVVAIAMDADKRHIFLTGFQAVWWVLGVVLLGFVVFGVWAFWCRPRLRTLIAIHAALLVVVLACWAMFRIEGFYGNLYPRLAWRWAPSAEQQWDRYSLTRDVTEVVLPVKEGAIGLSLNAHNHPGFLGANRDGSVAQTHLARDWHKEPPRELWRHPVGLGWGGFAVVGQHAFTQEQRGPEETVVCYDVRTGLEIWAHGEPLRYATSHGDGPRATPTVAAGRVYTMGGTGLLTCLSGPRGQVVWQQRTLADPATQNLLWGMAGSPLVCDDRVVVSPGGGPDRSLVAYGCQDGAPVWADGDDHAAYASPMVVTLAGRRQILSFNGAGLCGYDAASGAPLWIHPWVTQGSNRVNIAQPLVVTPFGPPADNEGFALISSGYGEGAALLRIVTIDGGWQVEEVWQNRELESKMSNYVVSDGFIYGLDNGVLVCIHLRDGRRAWKRGRYGHGQLLLVHDLLLIQAESGNVALVEATPDGYHECARLSALSSKTWNHPALAGGVLLVRNDREAAAYELPLEVLSLASVESDDARINVRPDMSDSLTRHKER